MPKALTTSEPQPPSAATVNQKTSPRWLPTSRARVAHTLPGRQSWSMAATPPSKRKTVLNGQIRDRNEFWVVPQRVEIGLIGNHVAKVAIDFQRPRQVTQSERPITSQAPIARQVVVQHGFARIDRHGTFQRVDRPR